MHCLHCHYDLANLPGARCALTGLSDDRCPECGGLFDRADPSTFLAAAGPRVRRSVAARLQTVFAVTPLVWLLFPYSAAVVGLLRLGRWPRWPQDHSAWHAAARPIFTAGLLALPLVLFVVPASIITTACLIEPARRERAWGWLGGRVALTVLCWGIVWTMFQVDPGRILHGFLWFD